MPRGDEVDEKQSKTSMPILRHNDIPTTTNSPILWKLVLDNTSQFSFGDGGNSACAFGALALGSLLLQGGQGLLPTNTDAKDRKETMGAQIALAVSVATEYKARHPDSIVQHASAVEVAAEFPEAFNLVLKTWTEVPDALVALAMNQKLVFPSFMLTEGAIQVQNWEQADVCSALQGFSGSGFFLTLTSMGYVCGLMCCIDGTFIIADTHSKSFERYGYSSSERGAYLVAADSPERAATLVWDFAYDSITAIRALQSEEGGGGRQADPAMQAINMFTLEMAAFTLCS
jgi:hypothetical protein